MLLDHYNTTFYQRLVGSNKSFHFRGQQLGIMQAAEPSDIIWDNAGLSAKNLFFRRFTSLLIIGLLLVGCTYLIFMISEEKVFEFNQIFTID